MDEEIAVSRKRRNASERIAELIKRHIVEGNLKPGDRLPSIEQLATEVGASRPTVREALHRLATAGWVETRQGVGTRVTRPTLAGLLNGFADLALSEGVTVSELLEVRKGVEGTAVRLAVERATDEELEMLEASLLDTGAETEPGDRRDPVEADANFHVAIARLTRNRFLVELVTFLKELLRFSMDGTELSARSQEAAASHRTVVQAMMRRDADEAVRLMLQHIDELDGSKRVRDVIIYCDAFGTGSIGGSFYILGQTLARLVSRRTWIKPSVQATGGGVENIQLAEDRKIGLGMAQADAALDAYRGQGAFRRPHRNLRVICSLRGLDLQIFALASTGIQSIADLKGKRIAVGAHGGASVNVSTVVLREYGLEPERDYLPQTLPFSTATAMLGENRVDAVFFLSSGQSPALVELALQHPLRFLSIDGEVVEALTGRYPYWYPSSIQPGTYPNQKTATSTIGVPTILITHKDVPEGDIYAITASIFEETSSLMARPFLNEFEIPLHPGAFRYFTEKGLVFP